MTGGSRLKTCPIRWVNGLDTCFSSRSPVATAALFCEQSSYKPFQLPILASVGKMLCCQGHSSELKRVVSQHAQASNAR